MENEKKEELGKKVSPVKKSSLRDFYVGRKIFLSNYNPARKYESEEYGVSADSFEEANEAIRERVKERIQELRGIKEVQTKE